MNHFFRRRTRACQSMLLASIFLTPLTLNASVCSDGTGTPPFLSAGAKPNLMLVIDNSGSMLDLAYVNNVGECYDNGFDATATYTGLYESNQWYKYVPGQQHWYSGTKYENGDIVYADGAFYKATNVNGSVSTGTSIEDDASVYWISAYSIDEWENGTVYGANSFVRYEDQLYYTESGGTANGTTIANDTGVTWEAKDHTWLPLTDYHTNDIVSYQGKLYLATSGGTSSSTSLHDDTGVTWKRLSEGYFETTTFTGIDDAVTYFESTTGNAYKNDDLLVHITDVTITSDTDDTSETYQSGVTAIAASGNFLNWASASKFDIQKKILTGGKFDSDEELLISEGRGCSSRGFLKEVAVTDSSNTSSVITFSIKGSSDYDSWIDSTDDTTRISILGLSTDGFIGSDRQQACKNAVDEISKGSDASQGQTSQYIDTCLAYDTKNGILAASNSAYNHGIHTCWSAVKKGYTSPNDFGNVNEIYNACDGIYENGVAPSGIATSDSGYMCYGVYNEATVDTERNGYVGRCYEPAVYADTDCQPKACTGSGLVVNSDKTATECKNNVLYKCDYNTGKNECKAPAEIVYISATGDECTPTSVSKVAQWTDDVNPNTADECVQQAMWDYCQSITLPEVIDPSDEIFNSGETWGLPGSLVDSGIIAMFGTDRPLVVIKGYIKETEAPEGLLHEVAPDLRMGAMAFTDNGALTECTIATDAISSDPDILTDPIIKYCPSENKDGAEVIAQIADGDITDLNTGNKHVDDIATAINDIKATAWTPLAEAVYNALGYYGQNTVLRLDSGDFLTETEDSSWTDPVQHWCQENYVLVITEGASTADINASIETLVNDMPSTFSDTGYSITGDGECTSGQLYGSTYLDDIVYYGKNAPVTSLYTTPTANPGQLPSDDGVLYDKQNVTSYFVVAGVPRDDDSTSECNPKELMDRAAENGGTTLYTGEDPSTLEANLRTALSDILFRASAGSAASVISSSRSGEGGVYQAIFWPQISRGIDEDPLLWVGDVHAFFIDSNGFLWDDYSGKGTTGEVNSNNITGKLWSEDTDGDGQLDDGEDLNGNHVLDGDRRIVTYFDEDTHTTKICFNRSVIDTGDCSQSAYVPNNNETEASVDLREFDYYLWSAKDRLAAISSADILENRDLLNDDTWDFTGGYPHRYIFTWNDIDNDGIVDSYEHISFDEQTLAWAESAWLERWTSYKGRDSLKADFNVSTVDELQDIVSWVRGYDEFEEAFATKASESDDYYLEDLNQNGIRDTIYRCRQLPDCDYSTVNRETWRLGDVIHSTPILVGRPPEGYHFIYNDSDYAEFYKKYLNRRQMIYFGANDGMLHAVNGGFYISGLNRFLPCSEDQRDSSGECIDSTAYGSDSATAYPALGDEMWAYVPYNLQPHLGCLLDDDYEHKYYVDAEPRIFDVRIFPDDDTHPNGWGTILVGHMRFGGAPQLADTSTVAAENREFISSYFVLDITDPEQPPTLLGEMTRTTETMTDGDGNTIDKYADLGYTTPMPSIVVMRDDNGNSEWFLVFGNGPTTIKGQNDQQGKVAIYPLNSLTGVNWKTGDGTVNSSNKKPFRIPNEAPSSSSSIPYAGRILIEAGNDGLESFVGDMVTVDYDLSSSSSASNGVAYKSDAVYFGTTDGTDFTGDPLYWNGGGRMYRLVTKDEDETGKQKYTYPNEWRLEKLLDAQAPITAAPNIGYDPENFWIYFGTGRFFASEDKTDTTTQRFFGVREPRDTNCDMTWGTINWLDDSGSPIATNPGEAQGSQGLFRSDLIKVLISGTGTHYGSNSLIYCENEDGTECTISGLNTTYSLTASSKTYYSFGDLEDYIRGEWCGTTPANALTIGIDGWYRNLTEPRERSLGMPTLLGGLVTYTSYQPFEDVCQAEGISALYGVYYLTGTAWYQNVFGTESNSEGNDVVLDKLDLGRGQAMTPSLHVGTPTDDNGNNDANAYIQTSTGEIIQVGQQNLPLNNFKSGRTTWTDQ